MSWAEAATPELAGVCRKCTGVGWAHYLTCPTLRRRPARRVPPRPAVPAAAAPGSYEAAARGCLCDVQGNNHGKYPPLPPDGWHITDGCPVHAPKPADAGQAAAEHLPDGPACVICNDTGVVQTAEQDGSGVYEQACPEPVHGGEADDWEPCSHDCDGDCYDEWEERKCRHQHCFNCGGCGCPGYCDDYQTYNLRPAETGGAR